MTTLNQYIFQVRNLEKNSEEEKVKEMTVLHELMGAKQVLSGWRVRKSFSDVRLKTYWMVLLQKEDVQ